MPTAAPPPPPPVRCRQIRLADQEPVADLLARGFPERSLGFWRQSLQTLAERSVPPGFPQFGYMLESSGVPVGVVLIIAASIHQQAEVAYRCNLSSWFVESAFRAHASALIQHALKRHPAAYINITASRHTWTTIEAQGFSRYSDGMFLGVPALASSKHSVLVHAARPDQPVAEAIPPAERDLMADHAKYGCISLWCETADGVYPFIFAQRRLKKIVPYAQLIYCRSIDDFVRFAGPIGRHLARRGLPLVMFDANGPAPGIPGRYLKDRMPKFFSGSPRPRLGDLTNTEVVLFGI